MSKDSPFSFLYDTREDGRITALGAAYQPPARIENGEEALVARIPATGDGHDVEIYELRMPARFFKLVAKPNKYGPGFTLSTGSGQDVAELLGKVAKAVAEGMLGTGG